MLSKRPLLALLAQLLLARAALGAYDASWYGSTAHPASLPAFRSVTDFGAVGDGVHDDTSAIRAAIDFDRGVGNAKTFAIVYFPCTAANTYLVSDTIVVWMGTELRGCSLARPTLRLPPSAPGFMDVSSFRPVLATSAGFGQNVSGRVDWWDNSIASNCIFYNMIHSLRIDLSAGGNVGATALYWCVAQQTSLRSLDLVLGDAAVGIDICVSAGYPHSGGGGNGGGGSIEDISVSGGSYAVRADSSQWAFRGIRLAGQRVSGVHLQDMIWSFAFLDVVATGMPAFLTTGSGMDRASSFVTVIDAVLANISGPAAIALSGDGSPVFLQNVSLEGAPASSPVFVANQSATWLDASQPTVARWAGWAGASSANGIFVGGALQAAPQAHLPGAPSGPLSSRPRPFYDDLVPAPCNAVADCGATGLNVTDDTAALQACVDKCRAVFLPGGVYAVSDTLNLTTSSILIGEILTNIYLVANAPGFDDPGQPKAVVSTPDDPAGAVQLSDLSLTTGDGNAGAVLLHYRSGAQGGIWDTNGNISHNIKYGFHFDGSAAGVVSNVWVWGADHSYWTMGPLTEDHAEVGILGTSSGPLTFVGVMAEHHHAAMLRLDGASNYDFVTFQTEQAVPIEDANRTVHIDLRGGSTNVSMYGVLSCNWWSPQVESLANASGLGPHVSVFGLRNRGSPNGPIQQPASQIGELQSSGGWWSLSADVDIPQGPQ